jgi:biotin transport system substrate-specific component
MAGRFWVPRWFFCMRLEFMTVRLPRSVGSLRPVVTLTELLWALIGLLLTIGGNFLQAAIVAGPWSWTFGGIPASLLGVNYQIGAVLLVSCLGGRNAGVISQIAYLGLGLVGFPFFAHGGGFAYLREPSFGYLLGFVPGAWVCGYLAFRAKPRLEWLAACCLGGMGAIHATGIGYLLLMHGLKVMAKEPSLGQTLAVLSGKLLPGQLAVTCAVTVVAFLMRRMMFY